MNCKMRQGLKLLASALLAAAPAIAEAEYVDVAALTGLYHLGDVAEPYYQPGYGWQPATYREAAVQFSWSGAAPRYLVHEVVGVIREPVGVVQGTEDPYHPLGAVNLNGGWAMAWPNWGWGWYANTNGGFSNAEFEVKSTYDQATGRFYFGIMWDTLGYSQSWQEPVADLNAVIHAVFYNASGGPATYEYSDRGIAFIEGARVGLLADYVELGTVPVNRLTPYQPSQVPEPPTHLLLLAGFTFGMCWPAARMAGGLLQRRTPQPGRH